MTVTKQDVVAAWQQMEAATGVLGVRRENKLAEEAYRLVVQALADAAVRADLLTLLDTTSDAGLKEWLRGRLLPDTVTAESDPDSFRSQTLVDHLTAVRAHGHVLRPRLQPARGGRERGPGGPETG